MRTLLRKSLEDTKYQQIPIKEQNPSHLPQIPKVITKILGWKIRDDEFAYLNLQLLLPIFQYEFKRKGKKEQVYRRKSQRIGQNYSLLLGRDSLEEKKLIKLNPMLVHDVQFLFVEILSVVQSSSYIKLFKL